MDSLHLPLSEIDQGENEIKISEKLYEELASLFKNDRDLEIDKSSSSSEEVEDTVLLSPKEDEQLSDQYGLGQVFTFETRFKFD